MAKTSSDDATDSFVGYLYQLRYALYEALQLRDPQDAVTIEFLDDISFHSNAYGTVRLHQAKHSIRRKARLGALSLSMWKALGNWANKVETRAVELNSTTLFFNTTGEVSIQSPFRHLKASDRNEKQALKEITASIAGCTNKQVLARAKHFVKLNRSVQLHVLERITVLDSSVDIAKAALEIERLLAVSSREHLLKEHRIALEGWFFDAVINGLIGQGNRFVTLSEIRNQSISVRDRLSDNFLPEVDLGPTPTEEFTDDSRAFVRQLQLINVSASKLRRARSTHYKALAHRSKWSRDGLLAIDELPKFDERLKEEWQIRHESACCESEGKGEAIEVREATRVYDWAETDAPNINHLVIRAFNGPFLVRGSFHILADRLEVGWHPRYEELLRKEAGDDE